MIAAIVAFKEVLEVIKDNQFSTGKEIVGEVNKRSKNLELMMTNGSITKLVSNYIVEPIIYVSNNAKDVEVIDKVLEVNTDIFSSFYIQAFEILKNHFDMDTTMVVKALGTDNVNGVGMLIGGMKLALDRQEYSDDYISVLLSGESLSFEDVKSSDKNKRDGIYEGNSAGTDAKDQATSLLMQRNLEIRTTVSKDGNKHEFIIPITIKAHIVFLSIDNILLSLNPRGNDKTFTYRWTDFKAGLVSVRNLIFCDDLIAEYKKNKFDDKADILTTINNRVAASAAKTVLTGMQGTEGNYNMYIVTAADKSRIDKQIGGNIYDEKYKQDLISAARAMTFTVVDADYERVVIITADIRGRSEITFKTLSKRKDSGNDLTEVLKALLVNKPPVF